MLEILECFQRQLCIGTGLQLCRKHLDQALVTEKD